MKFAIKSLLPYSIKIKWETTPDIKVLKIEIVSEKPGRHRHGGGVPEEIMEFVNAISDYFEGKIESIPLEMLDLSVLSQFQNKILCELRRNVPRGKVISYSKLAKLAGCPKGARAVGNVMRNNPFPLVFPCHRVIKNDGSIGGFMGGKKGNHLKQFLVERERIFS